MLYERRIKQISFARESQELNSERVRNVTELRD